MRAKIFLALVLLLGVAFKAAGADPAALKKALEARFPNGKVESVVKTPYFGLYEVVVSGQIFYTDDKLSYLFVGNVVDPKTLRNLTEERMRKLFADRFKSLPFDLAIKKVKGNGKRQVAIFSDPDCPFCQKLEREMVNVTDVTIYTFLFPIESLHPGATQRARAVWCAKDRVAAWDALMLSRQVPGNGGKCDNPVDKTVKLGESLGVQGTPTLIFPDGRMVPGAIPVAQLERLLNASASD